jgi:hypothetical protein
MTELQARSLDSPEETGTFDNGTAEITTVAGRPSLALPSNPGGDGLNP